jgi:hypothetical protein
MFVRCPTLKFFSPPVFLILASSAFPQNNINTMWTEPTTEAGTTYQRPPKFDYTEDGRPIMIKRFPYLNERKYSPEKKFRYLENMSGAEAMMAGLQTYPGPKPGCTQCRPLSEQQRKILREWGEPDYIRGPYKSTRNDFIIEWAYVQSNHLFQFADARMVYEGPLTDQERTAITYGIPREVMVDILEPNIRRETWVYRPYFIPGTDHERIFSFSNGKLVYHQESP